MEPTALPDPDVVHPLQDHTRLCFLKNVITRPTIIVGDYTYYDDPDGCERFQDRNVLYHFDFIGDRLIIGRYCAIAQGATFLMNGGGHALGGLSAYPFRIFGGAWADAPNAPEDNRGDTVVGHDVWIGHGATILPGGRLGSGCVVGAHAVVTREVPPYAVVAGNPARVVRMRYDEATVAALLDTAWWELDAAALAPGLPAIAAGDPTALRAALGR